LRSNEDQGSLDAETGAHSGSQSESDQGDKARLIGSVITLRAAESKEKRRYSKDGQNRERGTAIDHKANQ
jgi:hypothetical protein